MAYTAPLTDGLQSYTQVQIDGNVDLALFTGDPGDTGTISLEQTGAGYARIASCVIAVVGSVVSVTSAPAAAPLTFTASGAWPETQYVGLVANTAITLGGTAVSSGDLLCVVPLDTFKTLSASDTLTFAAGTINFTMD